MTQTHSNRDPELVLAGLGLVLPEAPKPVAAYIPWRRAGNLVYTAGQIALQDGKLLAVGSVPGQVPVEIAQACARQCALNALAVLKSAVGSLSAVKQVVRVGVWVCSEPGFYEQPKVANAASELLVEVFGEAGRHVRAAVGSVSLPLGSPVEVEVLVEV
jgi:enamine deaminase RidA (YjgF/YER057c/UK114 family)